MSPALVLLIVLTNAKIITVVSEPITAGNNIVKSSRLEPAPKTWYSAEAVM
jgi:hypothetical protein